MSSYREQQCNVIHLVLFDNECKFSLGELIDLKDIDDAINNVWEYYNSGNLHYRVCALSQIGSRLDECNNGIKDYKDKNNIEQDQINVAATTIQELIQD
eukprot:3424098-Ditylum_brightwellii.AAC.1